MPPEDCKFVLTLNSLSATRVLSLAVPVTPFAVIRTSAVKMADASTATNRQLLNIFNGVWHAMPDWQ